MRTLLVSIPVLASLALLAGPANAHIALSSPPARTVSQKDGPCGAGADDLRGATVATFKPGEKIVVTWTETVNHPGHFRIALDEDGQDDFFEPMSFDDVSGGPGVLVDGIADKDGGEYSQEVTLPDFECDNCVLQVIQMMTDKKPYGDGNDLYYQCSDIAIVGEVAATTGEPETTGATTEQTSGASTGGPDPSAGETAGGETASPSDPGATSEDPTSGGDTGVTDGNGGSTAGDEGATSESTGTGDGSTGATDGSAGGDEGCGCRGDADAGGLGWLALGLLPLLRRRRA